MQHIVYYSKKKDKQQPKINGYKSITGIRLDDFGPGDTKEVDDKTAQDLEKTFGFLTITPKSEMEKAAKAMEESEKAEKKKEKSSKKKEDKKTEKKEAKKEKTDKEESEFPTDWQELRKLASDKGIYEAGDNKETIINKLKKLES